MISVVMTVFKERWQWIEEALVSLVDQTYKNIQLIIIVDNPDFVNVDRINSILKGLNYKIKIHSENMGLVYSLNEGVEMADGSYIARMDSDDISESSRLERELRFLTKFNLDFVSTSVTNIDSKKCTIKSIRLKKDIMLKDIVKVEEYQNIFWHPTWLMKKEVFLKLKGYREVDYTEDYDFIARSLLEGFKLGQLAEPLLKKRINEMSISESNGLVQLLIANKISKSIRKNRLFKYNKRDFMVSSRMNYNFNKIRSGFNAREEMKFTQKIGLALKMIFTRTGIMFMRSVLIQKYQLKLLGLI